jgi:C-terminal processing protease CtpA/Prc
MRPAVYGLTVIGCLFGFGRLCAGPPSTAHESDADKPVVMEAFKIEGTFIPKLSFGLSLDVWKNNHTQKVSAIYVRGVKFGSSAARTGLCARTRIYSIDGAPVEDFAASFFRGTELYRKFVDRHEGDRVVLEVAVPGEGTTKFVTLEAAHSRNIPGFTTVEAE